MKNKWKEILIYSVSLLGVSLLLSLSFSSAYLTRSKTADNIISFGSLKLQLINHTLDRNGNEVEVTDESVVLENNDVSRIIKVKNVCENEMYVRIKLDMLGNENGTTFSVGEYISYRFSNDDWLEQDGWYYYKQVLHPEETSSDLLNGIVFDLDRLIQEHAGCKINLSISAQAVQSKNNASNVLEAEGWPEEDE